jgi:feruloyl-CoA synthase
MIFADHKACASLCPGDAAQSGAGDSVTHESVRAHFLTLMRSLAARATGSSNRVVRAVVLEEPPSLDAGEITDKGSLNQRAVIERRAALVNRLYSADPDPGILTIGQE